MHATGQTEFREPSAKASSTVSGGRVLQHGIEKHGPAFYADELAGFVSLFRQEVINHAAVDARCLLCGVEAGALTRGSRNDSYHGCLLVVCETMGLATLERDWEGQHGLLEPESQGVANQLSAVF